MARPDTMLVDGTPSHLGMQTPSLNQFGAGSPGFAVSPLAAPETLLFTPSSRKLLRSMAPNPMDAVPFDLVSGLTPQRTPPPPHGTGAGASATLDTSCKRRGRRSKAHANGGSLTPPPVTDSELIDAHDKPSAIRRLCFGRNDGCVAAAAPAPAATASMRPPPPPSVFESPLKRLRQQKEGVESPSQRPLFVPSMAAGSLALPETPSQEVAMAGRDRGGCQGAAQRRHWWRSAAQRQRDSDCWRAERLQHGQEQCCFVRGARAPAYAGQCGGTRQGAWVRELGTTARVGAGAGRSGKLTAEESA